MNKEILRLYLITDNNIIRKGTLSEAVEAAIQSGVTLVQYREKMLKGDALYEDALKVQAVCKKYRVPFIINDDVHLAKKIDADGVHVGQSDMAVSKARKLLGAGKIIGATAKTIEQAGIAEAEGADYLGSGAVFGSTTKKDALAMDFDTLNLICDSVSIPVVAIGGITIDNVNELKNTHVAGVAVISGILAQEDVGKATRMLHDNLYGKSLRKVLTIAGSDCSGGAGIQADIKTMTMNGVYAMSVITALTAQNTTGVTGILNVDEDFLAKQIDSVFTDIYPDAVKIGMLSSEENIRTIASKLQYYKAKNIVVDPVMVSTSGSRLIEEAAIEVLKKELLPIATVITPNIPEAALLAEMEISTAEDMLKAAKIINEKYGCAVLLKGGHSINDANDLLYDNPTVKWFYGKRIDNNNTHGTGCTLSSAIASNLAKEINLVKSIENSKEYISGALNAMLDIGRGSGPMNHAFTITGY